METGNTQRQKQSTYIHGFTLVETIVALSVSLIIVLGMTSVFVSGVRNVQAVKADTILTTNVSYMLQTLGYEVHRAQDVAIVSPTQATINYHDGSSVDIMLNGSLLEVGGNQITTSDVSVTALTLTKIGNSLHIDFTMQAGTSVVRTFTGQTTLTPRK